MAIIVVLAAVAIPTFGRHLETARETAEMETIRSAYNEALTYAIMDAIDGTLDAKNGGTTLAAQGSITTVGSGDDAGKYTVTLASMKPTASIAQKTADWQYVDKKLFGQDAPDVVGKTTITFAFTRETDGSVSLSGITAATAT